MDRCKCCWWWDDCYELLQGVGCSSTGRVVNLTVSVFPSQRGGNFSVNPKAKNVGASLGSLSELQNLNIYNVNFSAPLPKEWGNLRKLVTLDLEGGQFTGALPSSLGQLTMLQSFTLYGAFFTNGMPATFCNLVQLTTLTISGAGLKSLPPCLSSKLTKLTQLGVGINQIKGPFPTWVTQFPALMSLDMSSNQLSGPIPAAIGKLKKLLYLFLGYNSLSGHIPAEVGELTSLNFVDFSNNALTGPLPKAFGKLQNITYLTCNMNFLTGPLPDISGAPQLQSIDLSYNNITGSIPASWGNFKASNVYITLNNNLLTGMWLIGVLLCYWFCPPRSEFLSLGYRTTVWKDGFNQLIDPSICAGSLPPALGNLKGGSLYLSYNKLTGGIPASYANLFSFVVDHNQLSDLHQIGSLVPHNTSQIWQISGSGNSFAGPLPTWLASFETLQSLDLSHNKLTGIICYSFHTLVGWAFGALSEVLRHARILCAFKIWCLLKVMIWESKYCCGSSPFVFVGDCRWSA